MAFLITSTVLFFLGLVIVHWVHNQYQMDLAVTPAMPPSDPPLISICIPARNEQTNIRKCVGAALSQDYPNLEVIVVDDCSTDSTLTQLKEITSTDDRLITISGSGLPEGWAGKPHALHQASVVARGGWLCFVDADTFLEPQAISSCLAKALETGADLFTTMNNQILGSFWEKVVMPLIMTALSVGFPPRKANDPKQPMAIANGQFIMIKRSVYDEIGGHEKVKDQIVEDKALAEQVKWNGHCLIVADGSAVIRTRMYSSFATMWEGWTKNIYLGLRGHPLRLLLGAFGAALALIAALFLPIWPVLGIVLYIDHGGVSPIMIILESLIVWGALLYQRAKVARRMQISSGYALTTPLGSAVFAAMMLTSAWKVISGQGVTWRGRRYRPGN